MALIRLNQLPAKRPSAIAVMFAPLARNVWLSILGFVLLLVFLLLGIVYQREGNLNRVTLARAVIEEPNLDDTSVPDDVEDAEKERWRRQEENSLLANRFAMVSMRTLTKTFVTLMLILWGIIVVYLIVEERTVPVLPTIKQLSADQLGKYTMVRGGTIETIFRRAGKSTCFVSRVALVMREPGLSLTNTLCTSYAALPSTPNWTHRDYM